MLIYFKNKTNLNLIVAAIDKFTTLKSLFDNFAHCHLLKRILVSSDPVALSLHEGNTDPEQPFSDDAWYLLDINDSNDVAFKNYEKATFFTCT